MKNYNTPEMKILSFLPKENVAGATSDPAIDMSGSQFNDESYN